MDILQSCTKPLISLNISGLVQDCSSPIVLAMEILQSSTTPQISLDINPKVTNMPGIHLFINGSVQDCSIPSAMEILQSCIDPWEMMPVMNISLA